MRGRATQTDYTDLANLHMLRRLPYDPLSDASTVIVANVTCDVGKIWCLGTEIDGYKHIDWDVGGMSFADCDILIVDANSLSRETLESLDPDKSEALSKEISKRARRKDFVLICVLAHRIGLSTRKITLHVGGNEYMTHNVRDPMWLDNYFWHPSKIKTHRVGENASRLSAGWEGTGLKQFRKYFEEIKTYDVGLCIEPSGYPVATTRSGDVVARMYRESTPGAAIIMLPHLELPDESIRKVLEVLGVRDSEHEPERAKSIDIPGTSDIEQQIRDLEKTIDGAHKRISALKDDLKRKRQFRKLVYSSGRDLEDAVMLALQTIGLSVERRDEEDIILRPSANSKYTACPIEIKGLKHNICMDALMQLQRWVDDQYDAGENPKGILVSNTYRFESVEESIDKRSSLDRRNLDYAKKKNFCIVPTHVILDLCVKTLGGQNIDPQKIERTILSTDGFVRLEDFQLTP